MKLSYLRDISNMDGGRLGRVAMILLTLAVSFFMADLALAVCRFKAVAESGGQVAVAAAQPLYNNGQIEFRISRPTSGAVLEVRFKPGGKFKPRFTPSQVIQQLNEVQAGVRLIQLNQQAMVRRVKGWEFIAGNYIARFEMSEAFFSQIGTGFIDFGLELPEALKDIHPTGFADTSDCLALMAQLSSSLLPPTAGNNPATGILLSTKNLLTAYFKGSRGSPKIKNHNGLLSIELIDRDGLFSYYESKPTSETDVWDAIFLDLCVVDSPSDPKFVDQCKQHLPILLRSYPAICGPPTSLEERPKCAFSQLAGRNSLRVGGGRYDEGLRCLIWRDAKEKFDPEKNCKPY